jgi:hypothetical protein
LETAVETVWIKSSHSAGGNNADCVEVAFAGSWIAVRDSKSPGSGTLLLSVPAWRHLTGALA